MASFRVVLTPQGDAPEEVRKEWIGVVLPLKETFKPGGDHFEVGLFGRERVQPRSYVTVPVRAALKRLAQKSQAAALWFYENLPTLWFDRDFTFGVDEVEILETD